jgi:hypothetical protein
MERAKQFSVYLQNRPGALATVSQVLADAQVNIVALSAVETTHEGILRLVVDKPDVAAKALDEKDLMFAMVDVLLVRLPNRVGALAELARKLADRNVNISYVYGSTQEAVTESTVVLHVNRMAAAESVLADV